MSKRELVDYSRLWSLEDPLLAWTVTLILSVSLWVLSAHFYGFQMMRVGLHIRIGCSYLIYRKSLKLGQYESSQTTMGRMVSVLCRREEVVSLCAFHMIVVILASCLEVESVSNV